MTAAVFVTGELESPYEDDQLTQEVVAFLETAVAGVPIVSGPDPAIEAAA
jgi:hypothetical protein